MEEGEEEPMTHDQEVAPEPPRKRRAPLSDPELEGGEDLQTASPSEPAGAEPMTQAAEEEPKPAEPDPKDVDMDKALDNSPSLPAETMPETLNAKAVPGDMSMQHQDSQGMLLCPACLLVLFCLSCRVPSKVVFLANRCFFVFSSKVGCDFHGGLQDCSHQ